MSAAIGILIAGLSVALMLGIMVPTLLVSSLPSATIWLLERLRFYDSGVLQYGEQSFVGGNGLHRTSGMYTTSGPDGDTSGQNAKVFGYVMLVTTPVIAVISLVLMGVLGGLGLVMGLLTS